MRLLKNIFKALSITFFILAIMVLAVGLILATALLYKHHLFFAIVLTIVVLVLLWFIFFELYLYLDEKAKEGRRR